MEDGHESYGRPGPVRDGYEKRSYERKESGQQKSRREKNKNQTVSTFIFTKLSKESEKYFSLVKVRSR